MDMHGDGPGFGSPATWKKPKLKGKPRDRYKDSKYKNLEDEGKL